MLFPTFLLKTPCNENHISRATRATKAALRFRNHCVNDICQKTVTCASNLPAKRRRKMPRLLPQIVLSPFFLEIIIMLASFHCVGRIFDAHALLIKEWSRCSRRFPPYLKIPAGRPSGPAALLFVKLFAAANISSREGRVASSDTVGGCGS